jgi:hypothetical protein
MNARRTLQCRFLSYWHPGTGGGLGAQADARVRSARGLPVVPGRTLKGVLRDACARAEALGWFADLSSPPASTWTFALFGKPANAESGSVPGALRISSAELDLPTLEAYTALPASQQTEARKGMRAYLHQTALDDHGVAKDGSLRGIEVYVPIPLEARIELAPSAIGSAQEAYAVLTRCLPLVEGLGAHRTRGLGRVALSLEDRP